MMTKHDDDRKDKAETSGSKKSRKVSEEGTGGRHGDVPEDTPDGSAEDTAELSTLDSGTLIRTAASFTIGSLEKVLLDEFPREDAESWDRTGLLVGEAALPVTKVAVALDPTVVAISKAAQAGANVLVTHHPPYLDAPDRFAPEPSVACASGAGVWAAIENKVALMCFHTALDVSPRVTEVLPGMLGLAFTGRIIKPILTTPLKGYGQISDVVDTDGKAVTLASLAARCTSVFGRPPRVWGNFSAPVQSVVTATGSAGDVGIATLAAGIDCLICGEVKYHDALNLSQAGLAIIDLGHDVCELPLVAVLADTLASVGVAQEDIVIVDQSGNWRYPEAIRV